MTDFLHLLSYLRQPLVGAFTGYVTTDVAIRLLFHPLKPWHLFGVRIPLTPGVFPAKRYEFAEKVGVMVGSHLFTSDDVRQALQKEEFRRELKGAVDGKIDRLFAREMGTLESLFPVDFQRWLRDLVDQMRHRGMEEVYRYLESDPCAAEVRRLLHEMEDALLARDLHSLVTPEQDEMLRRRLSETVGEFLHSRQVTVALAALVDRKVEEIYASETPLGAILPEGTADAVASMLEQELQSAAEALTSGPEFRALLSAKIRESLRSAVGSLRGVPGFFAKFVDPDWLISQFPDFTQKIEQEMAAWLRDERTQEQISEALRDRVDLFLSRPWSELLSGLPYRRLAALRRLARMKVLRMLRGRQLAASVTAAVESNLDRLRERTLGELLKDMLSDPGVERVREEIAAEVLAALRSPVSRQTLEKSVSEKVEEMVFQRPIGHLSAFLPVQARDELTEAVLQQLSELLVKELPPLVDTLNIRKIVEDKVNALDIVAMEGLLLDIMKESFMFLNLFGAFLGFLIGIANEILPGFG
ncbi:DUF445 family protein [Geomesophilobacter sediminis]|uniref:DUF445 family protein n=1 Tax=Geomesophilobacter sediminis TaxID=2798584 RepID=A0A8J7M095_9BACT|nr:DUF445 family protein [Geomesophilobacter sediminis]MBJ6724017.1 DUF445 family protein [Geomesophilobacter sediminis]